MNPTRTTFFRALIAGALCALLSDVASANPVTVDFTTPAGATSSSFTTSNWFTQGVPRSGESPYEPGGFTGEYLRTDQGTISDPARIDIRLEGLSGHTLVDLDMIVAQIGSLDPNRDGDLFRVFIDGVELLQVGLGFGISGVFSEPLVSNFEIGGVAQSTGLVDAVRTQTRDLTFDEHVYDFGALDAFNGIEHFGTSLDLRIEAINGQGFGNESYGIDNIAITLTPVPAPTTLSLFALLGLLGLRRRR